MTGARIETGNFEGESVDGAVENSSLIGKFVVEELLGNIELVISDGDQNSVVVRSVRAEKLLGVNFVLK